MNSLIGDERFKSHSSGKLPRQKVSVKSGSKIKYTVEPNLIATEILVFPSKSSRNKNDSDPINGKTTPI